jgi:hypothetical protein
VEESRLEPTEHGLAPQGGEPHSWFIRARTSGWP